jgi:AGCS family alanine or glycine:cation symporter
LKEHFLQWLGLGGLLGVLIVGFQRAAFSNEAGAGSAAIAHSAVRTKYPASEGVVALLEPFIDTVVICTMTALVIIIFNILMDLTYKVFNYGAVEGVVLITATGEQLGGVDLTSMAFDSVIPGFSYVLNYCSCIICFFYNDFLVLLRITILEILFGKGKTADLVYKFYFYCL